MRPTTVFHCILVGVLGIAPTLELWNPHPTGVYAQVDPAEQLYQAGVQYYNEQKYQAAIAAFQKAQPLFRQQQNIDRELAVLEGLGLFYSLLGQQQPAIEAYQQQQTRAEQTGRVAVQANALGELGAIYFSQGRYLQATEMYEKSLALQRHLKDRQRESRILGRLGNVQIQLGNYARASEYLQEGLKIAQEVGDVLNQSLLLNSLGVVQSSQDAQTVSEKQSRLETAKAYYKQSLVIAQKYGFLDAQANTLNSLGSIAQLRARLEQNVTTAKQQYEQAFRYYNQALLMARQLQNVQLEAAILGSIGLNQFYLKQYGQAAKNQQRSWELARQSGDRELEAKTLSNWGQTLWKSGNLAEAEVKFQKSLDILDSLRIGLADLDKISIFDTQDTIFSRLQQVQVAALKHEAALETAERGRARAFVELLSRRLQGEETNQSLANVKPITISEIKRIAKERQATLVEYSIITDEQFLLQGKRRGEDQELFIWVVEPSGTVHFRQVKLNRSLSLDRNKALQGVESSLSLESLVEAVRTALGVNTRSFSFVEQQSESTVPYSNSLNPELQSLYKILIQPIVELLPQDPNRPIIFIPQRAIFYSPFAALQDQSGKFLIEQHTIVTAPAIQVLQLTQQQKLKLRYRGNQQRLMTNNALIVGNPEMPSIQLRPDEPPQQLTSLPGAEKEAKEIASLFKTQAVVGKQATKVWVTQQMRQARLIHLATHGLLTEVMDQGMPGAIALAPTSAQDNGFLTTREILQLNLQAELVVLSACDTGGGDLTGDGVIGLSRSFISAGVPSVIVSLWKVPDGPTAFLMTHFYQNLLQDPDRGRALRAAMLQTMKNYPDPKAWAAFTLIGETK